MQTYSTNHRPTKQAPSEPSSIGALFVELLKADPRTLDDGNPRRQRPDDGERLDDLDDEYPDDEHREALPAPVSSPYERSAAEQGRIFEVADQGPAAKPSQPHESPAPVETQPPKAAHKALRADSIDFKVVAVAAFEAFSRKGQEIDLECGLEVAQHGDQASAAVVAERVYPKIEQWQRRTHGHVILGEKSTRAQVKKWPLGGSLSTSSPSRPPPTGNGPTARPKPTGAETPKHGAPTGGQQQRRSFMLRVHPSSSLPITWAARSSVSTTGWAGMWIATASEPRYTF